MRRAMEEAYWKSWESCKLFIKNIRIFLWMLRNYTYKSNSIFCTTVQYYATNAFSWDRQLQTFMNPFLRPLRTTIYQLCGFKHLHLRIARYKHDFRPENVVCLGSALKPMRIRTQHFRSMRTRMRIRKITVCLSLGLHKGDPSFRRRFSPQKRTSSTSKHEVS